MPHQKEWERALVHHCAETLAGLKPASLLCLRSDALLQSQDAVDYGNAQFNRFGIRFFALGRCRKAERILIYREERLNAWLHKGDVRKALEVFGYDCSLPPATDIVTAGSVPQNHYPLVGSLLQQLLCRMTQCPSISDEIGLFLGYPVEDVISYAKDRGRNAYAMRGYWRVYHNPSEARKTFEAFHACRQCWLAALQNGDDLFRLLDAVACPVPA
ncbi:DUF3793 family protein [Levyella massiliensis]|uniref:DUF3793 family protein n=1 Tax=Levyella massiliensis TaxID=938289 RepID=UPI00035D0034|nr:DUF3793 family protein [Levyella massiliensis]